MASRNLILFMLPAASLATTKLRYYHSSSCTADSEIGDYSCHFSPWDVQACQHTPPNTFALIVEEIENGCTIMTYRDRSCTSAIGLVSQPDICFSSTSAGSSSSEVVVNSDTSNLAVHGQIGSWQAICSIGSRAAGTALNKALLERKQKRQEEDEDGYMYTEAVTAASPSSSSALTDPGTSSTVSTTEEASLLSDAAIESTSTTSISSAWWCSDCASIAAPDTTTSSGSLWTSWQTSSTTAIFSPGSGTGSTTTNATVSMGRPSITTTRTGNGVVSTGGAAAAAAAGAGVVDFAGRGGKAEMLAAMVVLGAALVM